MKLQKAIRNGKLFKRPNMKYWITIFVGFFICLDEEKKRARTYELTKKDVLADDWIIFEDEIEEKWYEGDFKKKWPNGVLCKVCNNQNTKKIIRPIIEYDTNPWLSSGRRFCDGILYWEFAIPVKPEEAPAIIGDSDEC